MAQFDVHRFDGGLVLDCQADLLDHLNSRFVVPLLPLDGAPKPAKRLNPIFEIDGQDHMMATQFASAVQRKDLGKFVTSLADRGLEITGAVDVLISGV
jgi:toxin CcdB